MDPVSAVFAGLTAIEKAVEAIAEATKNNDTEAEAKALAALDAEIASMANERDKLADQLANNRAEALAALHRKFMPIAPDAP